MFDLAVRQVDLRCFPRSVPFMVRRLPLVSLFYTAVATCSTVALGPEMEEIEWSNPHCRSKHNVGIVGSVVEPSGVRLPTTCSGIDDWNSR